VETCTTPPLRRNSPHHCVARGRNGRDFSTVRRNLFATCLVSIAMVSVVDLQPAGLDAAPTPSASKRSRAPRSLTRSVITQNCRGLKTDSRVTEFVSQMRERHVWAAGCQETWRSGQDEFIQDGYCFLGVGPTLQQGRGSAGVALVLSRSATAAWQAAGSIVHNDLGPRVIAAPMLAQDARTRRPLGTYLVSSYAPTSDATVVEWDTYYSALATAVARMPSGYVLVICSDANASIGRATPDSNRNGAVGPHGLDHVNASGRRLRSFLELHQLAALASFFWKRHYGTWMHPRSKLLHQLDHIFVARSDVHRFTDAGSRPGQLIDSDHRAVGCKLRITTGFQRKPDQRARLARLDYTSLYQESEQQAFARAVVDHLLPSLPSPPLPSPPPASPPPITLSTPYSALADALRSTALALLPKRARSTPSWFAAQADRLRLLIRARNTAFDARHQQPDGGTAERLQRARSMLQAAVRDAKSTWISSQCQRVNEGIVSARGSKAAWDTVSLLRAGLQGVVRRSAPAKMRKSDGTLASTPEENAGVFAEHFTELYGVTQPFDPSVLDQLPQRAVFPGIDGDPTDKEIHWALGRLHDTGPGPSGLPARVWKALGSTEDSFALVRQMVLAFWTSEAMPAEWETGLLKILPKKGNKSLPGNYRGIMMLEVAYKIVANILHARLTKVCESVDHVDHEPQCGFRGGRGCGDAIFTLKQLIRKRREHGLETWVLFIDLVKAFDRVPRAVLLDPDDGLLWLVLLKYGVPPKLVSLLREMHRKVLVQFDVDGIIKTIEAIIGVKQGDLLGPILFTFFMAAVMETWRATSSYELPTFRSRPDFQMTGRRSTARGDEFTIGDSEYADDTGMPFCSRRDLDEQTPRVSAHFGRWGMEVHEGTLDPSGNVEKESKSEVLFCSAPLHTYTNASTFDGADLSHVMLPRSRFIRIVSEFPYLGDMMARDGSDGCAVDSRIAAAGKAFGALRKCVFSSTSVNFAAKRAVFESIILSILLYGCEGWSLTERHRQQLRVFHAQCLRAMCRVTRKHTWDHHISTQELGQRLGIETIDTYITRRQLRWGGHVRRMDYDRRLPRRMLSSWIAHPRPRGAPKMTYGRSFCKALKQFHIDHETWPDLAADRSAWRETLRLGQPAIRRSTRIAQRPRTQLPAALRPHPRI
jgi:hypothetical protein